MKKLCEIKPIRLLIITIFINLFIMLIIVSLCFSSKSINNHVTFLIITLLTIIEIAFINKAKKYIEELEEKQDIYTQILESLPNGIFVHKKLKFIYTNTQGAMILDAKPEEVIGKPVEDFVSLNKEVIGDERIKNALREEEFEPLLESKVFNKNGNVVDIEVFSKPIFINGKVAVLNMFKDITEQKRIRELKKKIEEEERKLKETMEFDRLRKEFFANLSHELRTPLTMIFGLVQMLEMDLNNCSNKDEKVSKHLVMLKQNCYRLLRLVNNLIDITKIDAGYYEIELQNHNIVSIIEDITLSVVDYVEDKGMDIQFDTNTEEKLMACDPDKIERIILNLLSNSIKFMKPGGRIVVNLLDKGENVEIRVKDTGIGIPEDKLNIIFERFRQVDKSFTRKHEGSGIGLSLVKSLVEMHDGSITVNSEYGKGTEFIIVLPVRVVEVDRQNNQYKKAGENCVERIQIEFSDIYS